MDKCTEITFRGSDRDFNTMDQKVDHLKTVKDLGIQVADNLIWKRHIDEQLMKANKSYTFSTGTLQ